MIGAKCRCRGFLGEESEPNGHRSNIRGCFMRNGRLMDVGVPVTLLVHFWLPRASLWGQRMVGGILWLAEGGRS